MKLFTISILSLALGYNGIAQNSGKSNSINTLKNEVEKNIQTNYDGYKKIALNIWDYAEVGFKETKSSLLLQNTLKENGFKVDAGVAGMPTAFVATYGSGSPVVAILAEFDALPGLSQAPLMLEM